MATEKVVVEGSSGVTALQLKDLFRQIGDKSMTGTYLQAALDHRVVMPMPVRVTQDELFNRNPIPSRNISAMGLPLHSGLEFHLFLVDESYQDALRFSMRVQIWVGEEYVGGLSFANNPINPYYTDPLLDENFVSLRTLYAALRSWNPESNVPIEEALGVRLTPVTFLEFYRLKGDNNGQIRARVTCHLNDRKDAHLATCDVPDEVAKRIFTC